MKYVSRNVGTHGAFRGSATYRLNSLLYHACGRGLHQRRYQDIPRNHFSSLSHLILKGTTQGRYQGKFKLEGEKPMEWGVSP